MLCLKFNHVSRHHSHVLAYMWPECAHCHSPAGGQGSDIAISTFNLGWKLARASAPPIRTMAFQLLCSLTAILLCACPSLRSCSTSSPHATLMCGTAARLHWALPAGGHGRYVSARASPDPPMTQDQSPLEPDLEPDCVRGTRERHRNRRASTCI